MSFASYLATLDAGRLAALLERRPDVLLEPVPGSLDELVLRLEGFDSVNRVLVTLHRDAAVVLKAAALLPASPVDALAARLRSPVQVVGEVVDALCGLGLAWVESGRVHVPAPLAGQFGGTSAILRPLRSVGAQAYVEHLRDAVGGLGGDPAGLLKPALLQRYGELVDDPDVVGRAVAALPSSAAQLLHALSRAGGYHALDHRRQPSVQRLVDAGLLLSTPYGVELPREVAVQVTAAALDPVTGRPPVAAAADVQADGRAGADGALLALTTLLDESRVRPVAALKKGGVGTRERTRLAKTLKIAEPALWIDLAHAVGLLAQAEAGFGATDAYDAWRDGDAATRWAGVALAWFTLDLAPTSRETDDGEVAPPLPLHSGAGMLRRALLRAAAGGGSLRAAAAELDWFCPWHAYDAAGTERKTAAARHEAELLGVVSGDRLTALGELLVEVVGRPEAAEELARRGADLLPEARGMLVLQSDLTAVVSGQPTAAAARLLAAAAIAESRGVAATWRFSPATVRAAMDEGWTADALRAELVAVSGRELPQPLDYLVTDVARRHGGVRVREVRCCVTGAEGEVAEILHTRALAKLGLSRLAPTVLACSAPTADVLAALRAAGFAPMPEDATGAVVLPPRPAAPSRARRRATRPRVAAADLAARLLAGPALVHSDTHEQVALLARHLDAAEVALLADALDHGRDVRIRYRNSAGNRSTRVITPKELYHRWIAAWCHEVDGEREFTVAKIERVAPVG